MDPAKLSDDTGHLGHKGRLLSRSPLAWLLAPGNLLDDAPALLCAGSPTAAGWGGSTLCGVLPARGEAWPIHLVDCIQLKNHVSNICTGPKKIQMTCRQDALPCHPCPRLRLP